MLTGIFLNKAICMTVCLLTVAGQLARLRAIPWSVFLAISRFRGGGIR